MHGAQNSDSNTHMKKLNWTFTTHFRHKTLAPGEKCNDIEWDTRFTHFRRGKAGKVTPKVHIVHSQF